MSLVEDVADTAMLNHSNREFCAPNYKKGRYVDDNTSHTC